MSQSATSPPWEIADILRLRAASYIAQHPVSSEQARVIRRLLSCRTAALGGHRDRCEDCGIQRVSYNSCRDRHCPKCQAGKRAQWLDARLQRLLPVPYFHVVFTLPAELRALVAHNARRLYGLLFEAASASITTLAADPKRLGAQVGMTAVLHTWGQNLAYHPHLHCVVTGGGLSLDGQRWVHGSRRYFLPVRVLAKLFRGRFLSVLKALHHAGELVFPHDAKDWQQPLVFRKLLRSLYRQPWVVYAKRPFASAEHVFRYLGRYTHRVAITNQRLVAVSHETVSFTWKNYAAGGQRQLLTLATHEFLRRFMMHVLPKGFVRLRHYGLFATGAAKAKWERSMTLLGQTIPEPPPKKTWVEQCLEWFGIHPLRCPQCQKELVRQPLEPQAAPCPPTPPPANPCPPRETNTS